MDYILLAFAVTLVVGARFRFRGIFDDYLGKDAMLPLRGIFALTVIFHHLAQRTQGSRFFSFFSLTGYLSVALFFFISGFGLMAQHRRQGPDYLKGFLRRRFMAVGLPLLLFLALYTVVIWYCDRVDFWAAMGKSVWVSNSWFMFALLFYYLCFALFARICKGRGPLLLLMLLASGLYIVLRLLRSPQEFWWYNSCLSFNLGMLWAAYHEPLTRWLKRFWALALALETAAFLPCFMLAEDFAGTPWHIMLAQGAAVFFCAAVFTLSMKLRMNNRALRYLGAVAAELYLVHGLVIVVLRCARAKMPDDLLFSLTVIIVSLALAYPVHRALTHKKERRKISS